MNTQVSEIINEINNFYTKSELPTGFINNSLELCLLSVNIETIEKALPFTNRLKISSIQGCFDDCNWNEDKTGQTTIISIIPAHNYDDLFKLVTEFYKNNLTIEAIEYIKNRGLKPLNNTGFATKNNTLLNFFKKEYPQYIPDLYDTGLIKDGKYGQYDHFRNRIIFPVIDNGKTVGFIGRALDNNPIKYLNSSFNKKEYLYEIEVESDEVIVCEGLLDALMVSKVFKVNAVAILGSKLSQEQLKKLLKYRKITFAFDGDEAGKRALNDALESTNILLASHKIIYLKLENDEDPCSLGEKLIDKDKFLHPLYQEKSSLKAINDGLYACRLAYKDRKNSFFSNNSQFKWISKLSKEELINLGNDLKQRMENYE